MPDPVTGSLIAGAAANTVGGFFNSNADRKAAEAANKRTGIPPDTTALRGDLSEFFRNIMSGGAPLGITSPLVESARNSLRGILGQGTSGKNLGFDPLNAANIIGEARRPVFQQNLTESLGQANAATGLRGLRPGASSDNQRITNTVAADASNQFESSVLDLIPQLQSNQTDRLGILGNLANQSLATGSQADFQSQYGLLPLILQYATSYPQQPAYQSHGSPFGTALQGGGDAAMLYALLGGNNTPRTTM